MWVSFVQAATILVREGLEAMLVIAALAGYLGKVGAGDRVKVLYAGALMAVAASFLAAWIFAVFNSGQHDDTMEAVVILLASAIMLYVSGWLMLKQDPASWKTFVADKAEHALAQGTNWAIGMLAFLSVFREGAETVLFITALANAEGGWTVGIFAGLGAAALLLAVLFYVLNRLAHRIPLRPLFVVTSVFLFITALKFIGDAIQEFQEQNIIAADPMPGGGWLEAIGLNATSEALTAQFVVALFVLAAFSIARREQRLALPKQG